MPKLYSEWCFLVAAMFWTAGAHAAEGAGPVDRGTFVLSAEHLTGVVHDDLKSDGEKVGITTIALFGYQATTVFDMPRIAFDGFVIDGLSIGGSLAVFQASLDVSGENSESYTDVLIAPRVGYAYLFSRSVGIWPRAGFSYWHRGFSDAAASTHAFAFDADCPLVFFPAPRFAITVGPILDVTFGGSVTTDTVNVGGIGGVATNQDISLLQLGLSAGVAGFF
jgi:hypothetical protein